MKVQHKNPTEHDRTAIAPYNFVTLPAEAVPGDERAARTHDRYVGHSGYFECTLRTWSPLYIRSMMTAADYLDHGHKAFADLTEAQKNERAKFFADARRRPQIPASSLRGMLRNVFEIVSHGKFTRVTNRRLAFRSFGKDNLNELYRNRLTQASKKQELPFKAGYIRRKDGEWGIQPAQMFDGVSFCRVKHAQVWPLKEQVTKIPGVNNARWIYVKPGSYALKGKARTKMAWAAGVAAKQAPEHVKGAWVSTGDMKGKKSDAVVYPIDEKAEWLPLVYTVKRKVGQDVVEQEINVAADYLNQVSQEQSNLLGDTDGALREGQPVFYILTDPDPVTKKRNVIFFGHTMMMRLLYAYSPLDLVPQVLRDEAKMDIPDAVFGYVRGRRMNGAVGAGAQSGAGRVSFTPGVLVGAADVHVNQRPITPAILSSPKPTTFQHYLAQDNPDAIKSLRTFDDANSVPRGHKLYWHKGRIGIEKLQAKDTTHPKQLTRITPLRDNAEFRFRVTFDNLTDVELGALAWVMQLASGASERRFKLGMGKALGMGAVSIDAAVHLIDRSERYATLVDEEAWSVGVVASALVEERIRAARAAFESEILRRGALNTSGVKALAELPRIRELLQMMAWPGPTPSETRYMEIERKGGYGKVNEYLNRPVLPSPLAFTPAVVKPAQTAPEVKPPAPPPSAPVPPKQAEPVKTSELSTTTLPPPPPPPKQTADIVTVKVIRIDAGAIVCEVPGQAVVGKLPLSEWRSGPKPESGMELRVRVIGQSQRGEFKLTTKGGK
jgi:CRISPR-associated protein (TIGR03986 family)